MKIKHHLKRIHEFIFGDKGNVFGAIGACYNIFIEQEKKILELEERIKKLEQRGIDK